MWATDGKHLHACMCASLAERNMRDQRVREFASEIKHDCVETRLRCFAATSRGDGARVRRVVRRIGVLPPPAGSRQTGPGIRPGIPLGGVGYQSRDPTWRDRGSEPEFSTPLRWDPWDISGTVDELQKSDLAVIRVI